MRRTTLIKTKKKDNKFEVIFPAIEYGKTRKNSTMAEALSKQFSSINITTPNNKLLDIFAIVRKHFPRITDLFKKLDSSKLFQLRKYCVTGERLFIRVGDVWEEHVIMEKVSDSQTTNTYLTRKFRAEGEEVYMKVSLRGGSAWEIVPRVVELKKYYSYQERNTSNDPFVEYPNLSLIHI